MPVFEEHKVCHREKDSLWPLCKQDPEQKRNLNSCSHDTLTAGAPLSVKISASFHRFLFCFHAPFLAILSFFLVPLPLSYPFAFFYHCFLFLFPLPCPVLLFLYSVCLQFAACKGWAHMLANLCMHTYTHRLTVRMSALFPKIAARKGEEKQWQETWTFYPFHCSMRLSSSLFLSSCLFPFLVLLSFYCLVVLDISNICVFLFPVPFFSFSFVLCPFLLSFSVSFPPPSPFCCHVPFLAVLPCSCSSSLCFPFPFSAIELFPLPFSSSLSCPFACLLCRFAVCSVQRLGTYVICVHPHTHRLTVRMPVLIPKIATRKGGRRNNDRKIGQSTLFIVPFAFPLPSSFPPASFLSFASFLLLSHCSFALPCSFVFLFCRFAVCSAQRRGTYLACAHTYRNAY